MHGQWPDPAADDDGVVASLEHQYLTQEAIDGTDDKPYDEVERRVAELMQSLDIEGREYVADRVQEQFAYREPVRPEWSALVFVVLAVVFGSWLVTSGNYSAEGQGFILGSFSLVGVQGVWCFACSVFATVAARRSARRRAVA